MRVKPRPAVIHVDDAFVGGDKEMCDTFGRDLGEMVPVKNLGELWLYDGRAYYIRDE